MLRNPKLYNKIDSTVETCINFPAIIINFFPEYSWIGDLIVEQLLLSNTNHYGKLYITKKCMWDCFRSCVLNSNPELPEFSSICRSCWKNKEAIIVFSRVTDITVRTGINDCAINELKYCVDCYNNTQEILIVRTPKKRKVEEIKPGGK